MSEIRAESNRDMLSWIVIHLDSSQVDSMRDKFSLQFDDDLASDSRPRVDVNLFILFAED